uniref:Uncharacterized protein n=1 Tax=Triticum urartu TaxID=4572 RepID=A0A8R7Q3D6_TRIUA
MTNAAKPEAKSPNKYNAIRFNPESLISAEMSGRSKSFVSVPCWFEIRTSLLPSVIGLI